MWRVFPAPILHSSLCNTDNTTIAEVHLYSVIRKWTFRFGSSHLKGSPGTSTTVLAFIVFRNTSLFWPLMFRESRTHSAFFPQDCNMYTNLNETLSQIQPFGDKWLPVSALVSTTGNPLLNIFSLDGQRVSPATYCKIPVNLSLSLLTAGFSSL